MIKFVCLFLLFIWLSRPSLWYRIASHRIASYHTIRYLTIWYETIPYVPYLFEHKAKVEAYQASVRTSGDLASQYLTIVNNCQQHDMAEEVQSTEIANTFFATFAVADQTLFPAQDFCETFGGPNTPLKSREGPPEAAMPTPLRKKARADRLNHHPMSMPPHALSSSFEAIKEDEEANDDDGDNNNKTVVSQQSKSVNFELCVLIFEEKAAPVEIKRSFTRHAILDSVQVKGVIIVVGAGEGGGKPSALFRVEKTVPGILETFRGGRPTYALVESDLPVFQLKEGSIDSIQAFDDSEGSYVLGRGRFHDFLWKLSPDGRNAFGPRRLCKDCSHSATIHDGHISGFDVIDISSKSHHGYLRKATLSDIDWSADDLEALDPLKCEKSTLALDKIRFKAPSLCHNPSGNLMMVAFKRARGCDETGHLFVEEGNELKKVSTLRFVLLVFLL